MKSDPGLMSVSVPWGEACIPPSEMARAVGEGVQGSLIERIMCRGLYPASCGNGDADVAGYPFILLPEEWNSLISIGGKIADAVVSIFFQNCQQFHV